VATETVLPFTETYHSSDVLMLCTTQVSRGLQGDRTKVHNGQQSRIMDAGCRFKSTVGDHYAERKLPLQVGEI
jgi:hypothetical protein